MGVLSNLVIAITGILPAEPSNIKKWVEANDGKWSARVNSRVTHLVASKDAWTRVTDPVLEAGQLGMHIVSYDWLEDSLQKRRKLAEKKYTFEAMKEVKKTQRKLKKMGIKADSKSKHLLRKPNTSKSFFFASAINTPFVTAKEALVQRRAEREAAEATEKAAKAAKAAKKASSTGTAQAPIVIEEEEPASHARSAMPTPPASVSPAKVASPSPSTSITSPTPPEKPEAKRIGLKDLYHYYLDTRGFEYKITLVRSNFAQNQITRYHLSILESHVEPHTYCTLVQYVPPPQVTATTDTSDNPTANIRNPLLKFLNRSVAEPPKPSIPVMDHALPNPTEAARLRALIAPRDEPAINRSELARLHALITPSLPSPDMPYKSLVCPMNSPFPAAWRTFRHIFRDLTLLSWEERFDTDKAIQKSRAQALNIEPYIYAKPPMGTPVGLQVQEHGLYHGHVGDVFIAGDGEDGYMRNEFNLPAMDEPLGKCGVVGSAIWREEEEVRRREEARKETVKEKERKEREAEKTKRTAEHRRPAFNGVLGKPEPWENRQVGNGAGRGAVVKTRKYRPFNMRQYD